jgi:hypothetical protein
MILGALLAIRHFGRIRFIAVTNEDRRRYPQLTLHLDAIDDEGKELLLWY